MPLPDPLDNVYDSWPAGASLTATPARFVQMGSSGFILAATAGQRGILGVLQNNPASGALCFVCGGGQAWIEAGVAVTKGAALMSDASGRAITAAVSSANHIYGYALEAASGLGVKFRMAFGYHGPSANDA